MPALAEGAGSWPKDVFRREPFGGRKLVRKGQSYYAGDGLNQALVLVDAFISSSTIYPCLSRDAVVQQRKRLRRDCRQALCAYHAPMVYGFRTDERMAAFPATQPLETRFISAPSGPGSVTCGRCDDGSSPTSLRHRLSWAPESFASFRIGRELLPHKSRS